MKQLTQKLKDGTMSVLEVPTPLVGRGMILVRNHFSLISAGTEGGTVASARKSLIGKAKERPQQVQQVVDTLKQQGPVQTYRAVMKKLDSYSPLGYSSAGHVVDVAPEVKGFSIGDRVACAGAGYANHAEFVSVPASLCVKLPDSADLAKSAYNTVGAIALQGIRQADLRVGETCVVIGLGLLGQLTALMLRASGIKVVGLDINSSAVQTGLSHCLDAGFVSEAPDVPDSVYQITDGIGADAVIITAATHSTQPINLAGKLLRQRGTVVVVGAVPTGFNREPDYYRKELSLKMSCSYGPGRYDLNYEEKGQDYPAGYVRWTENRNMQAFQDLVHSGRVDLSYVTTHRFSIDDAPKAYDLIQNRNEDFLGIMLEYDVSRDVADRRIAINGAKQKCPSEQAPGIGFIGAGSYAMSHLLPNLPRDGSVALNGVMTSSGTSSRSVAEKYGFSYCASSAEEIINDTATNTVFIATRHDSHAQYVKKAIEAGNNVFVEKPICLNQAELDEIVDVWRHHQSLLMVGFNRRFSPLTKKIKDMVGNGVMSIMYRINSGKIPGNAWIQDSDIGGGRIVGEVCHFIDFMVYMTGSLPTRINAASMSDPEHHNDTLNISLSFENGSIGTVCYFANGPKALPKEYIEVYHGGSVAILNDFKELTIYGARRPSRDRLLSQDKGQKVMMNQFFKAIKSGGPCPIPLNETYASTMATFAALGSLRLNQSVSIQNLKC